ncbi:DNA repair protein RAD10 [Lachancea thermotolerans CBS 6340]|uniref:KLTH0E16390p n=1 Tax=Lachancea thermotolerans (strain ATCC 56472 / CBS 6340 / NRRL Y-8284) TaxID=559295 RepID=C5DIZ5_LACTC|nr:KLTH0E16390p [Lachancea thermotolerans CBS 6340]CAR23756.1 KLTH0E16390p [Lachancea thermotolerans CBS 6340]
MSEGATTSFESILAGVQRLREGKAQAKDVQVQPQAERKPPEVRETQKRELIINAFNQRKQDFNRNEPSEVEDRKRKWGNASAQGKTVLVSSSQRGNPLLSSMANTNWRYVSSTGGNKVYYDYCVQGRNIIFLSLKYHKLHPEYISKKIQPLVKNKNNILICVVDVENSENILKDLNKACMFNGFALLLAFNFEQAAKYIIFMNK